MQTHNAIRHPAFANQAAVEKLEECLRSELSAMETYELALKSVTHVGLHRTLQEIFVSHSRRADLLRARIGLGGAERAPGSGIWGTFAKAFQVGADLLGDRAAIAALEQGEDRSVKLYSEGLDGCDAETLTFFARDLAPEQQRTHDLCKTLKTFVTAPS